MRGLLVMGLAGFAGLAGWATPTVAGFFSITGPVIAIVAGELFLGEAEGNLGGSGTIRIQARAKPEVTCQGQFTYSAELGDAGNMRCSDGDRATFQFQRLSLARGYGTGRSSRGSMSFTYGLSATESEPYLKLPPGKVLRLIGKDLVITDAPSPEAAPAALLGAATLAVTASFERDRNLQTNSPERLAELVEFTILPLFDFRHMTQLAVARHWRLASPHATQLHFARSNGGGHSRHSRGDAKVKNILWQVAGAVTLGATARFGGRTCPVRSSQAGRKAVARRPFFVVCGSAQCSPGQRRISVYQMASTPPALI